MTPEVICKIPIVKGFESLNALTALRIEYCGAEEVLPFQFYGYCVMILAIRMREMATRAPEKLHYVSAG
jgi:hypothetical protein